MGDSVPGGLDAAVCGRDGEEKIKQNLIKSQPIRSDNCFHTTTFTYFGAN